MHLRCSEPIIRSRLPGDLVPKVIGILGFDGAATLDFIGPLEAFKAARTYDNYHRTHSCYEVVMLGLNRKTFVSESGIVFKSDKTADAVSSLDTVIIPGGSGCNVPGINEGVSSWLRTREGHMQRVASVSGGIYALAESGLIDSRRVATHWRFSRDVAQRFPKLQVNYTASFLKDGPFYTCGGGAAGMEMTLALINEDYGPGVALEVAREFVMRLRPAGAEESLIYPPQPERESAERLADLPAWILAHLDNDLFVEVLAERACLCPRHFSRLFKRVFKATPAEFVEQLRLGEGRRRLLIPGTTIRSVALSVGFKSADAFRRAFERELGLTPSSFRTRFQPRGGSCRRDRRANCPIRSLRPEVVSRDLSTES